MRGLSWQDWTFSIGNVVLSAGLVPQLFDAQKPPITTAATVVAVLAVFVVTEWSLRLRLSAACTVAQIAVWVTLAGQRLAQ